MQMLIAHNFNVTMVACSVFDFWQKVLLATRILWIHSEQSAVLFPYVNEILEYMQNSMELNLRVSSWVQPMIYVMNDKADPKKDITKLCEFIDGRIEDWDNSKFIKAYQDHLKEMLDDYLFDAESC